MRARHVDARMTRAGLIVSLLLGACTDPRHPRTYPRWVTDSTNAGTAADPEVKWADCAGLRAFVRKTGKEGIGVTLEVRSRTDCPARIASAGITFPDRSVAPATIPAVPELRGRSLRYLWMPIHFDGDARWNEGTRKAQLHVQLEIDGAPQPALTWPLIVLWNGPYLP